MTLRVGVDVGGTKIEAAVLSTAGATVSRIRMPTPPSYEGTVEGIVELVQRVEDPVGKRCTVGLGVPGSIDPRCGRMRNSNAVFLNGRPLAADLEAALGRPVKLANDANCLALSEVVDGAAVGARTAFAVVIGTGVGGGLVVDGRIVEGANGIGGEWGHVALPWMTSAEHPGPACWCGHHGCLDMFISGTGLRRDHETRSGERLDGSAIVAAAGRGDTHARSSLDAYIDRLGRSLAMIVNIVDPNVFVLGGGMSNVAEIYPALPDIIRAHAFGGTWNGSILPARWGDSSGVRGAARLWGV